MIIATISNLVNYLETSLVYSVYYQRFLLVKNKFIYHHVLALMGSFYSIFFPNVIIVFLPYSVKHLESTDVVISCYMNKIELNLALHLSVFGVISLFFNIVCLPQL